MEFLNVFWLSGLKKEIAFVKKFLWRSFCKDTDVILMKSNWKAFGNWAFLFKLKEFRFTRYLAIFSHTEMGWKFCTFNVLRWCPGNSLRSKFFNKELGKPLHDSNEENTLTSSTKIQKYKNTVHEVRQF